LKSSPEQADAAVRVLWRLKARTRVASSVATLDPAS